MTDKFPESKIDDLLGELENAEPETYELGTPSPITTAAASELISMGKEILPYLQQKVERSTPRTVASIVFIASQLGGPELIEWLTQLRIKFEGMEPKTQWTYSVIGQCNVAIDRLRSAGQD